MVSEQGSGNNGWMPAFEARIRCKVPVRSDAIRVPDKQRIRRKGILVLLKLPYVVAERSVIGNHTVTFARNADHSGDISDSTEFALPAVRLEDGNCARRAPCGAQCAMQYVHQARGIEVRILFDNIHSNSHNIRGLGPVTQTIADEYDDAVILFQHDPSIAASGFAGFRHADHAGHGGAIERRTGLWPHFKSQDGAPGRVRPDFHCRGDTAQGTQPLTWCPAGRMPVAHAGGYARNTGPLVEPEHFDPQRAVIRNDAPHDLPFARVLDDVGGSLGDCQRKVPGFCLIQFDRGAKGRNFSTCFSYTAWIGYRDDPLSRAIAIHCS